MVAGAPAAAKKEKKTKAKNAGGGDKGAKEGSTAKDWPPFIEVNLCYLSILCIETPRNIQRNQHQLQYLTGCGKLHFKYLYK